MIKVSMRSYVVASHTLITRRVRLSSITIVASAAALTACGTSSTGPEPVRICGHLFGGEQFAYYRLYGDYPDTHGWTGPASSGQTIVRISRDCARGGSIAISPTGSARTATVVTAGDGKPEAVQVTLVRGATHTTLLVRDYAGTRRRLVLRALDTSRSSTPPAATPTSPAPESVLGSTSGG